MLLRKISIECIVLSVLVSTFSVAYEAELPSLERATVLGDDGFISLKGVPSAVAIGYESSGDVRIYVLTRSPSASLVTCYNTKGNVVCNFGMDGILYAPSDVVWNGMTLINNEEIILVGFRIVRTDTQKFEQGIITVINRHTSAIIAQDNHSEYFQNISLNHVVSPGNDIFYAIGFNTRSGFTRSFHFKMNRVNGLIQQPQKIISWEVDVDSAIDEGCESIAAVSIPETSCYGVIFFQNAGSEDYQYFLEMIHDKSDKEQLVFNIQSPLWFEVSDQYDISISAAHGFWNKSLFIAGNISHFDYIEESEFDWSCGFVKAIDTSNQDYNSIPDSKMYRALELHNVNAFTTMYDNFFVLCGKNKAWGNQLVFYTIPVEKNELDPVVSKKPSITQLINRELTGKITPLIKHRARAASDDSHT